MSVKMLRSHMVKNSKPLFSSEKVPAPLIRARSYPDDKWTSGCNDDHLFVMLSIKDEYRVPLSFPSLPTIYTDRNVSHAFRGEYNQKK
jgi:hypothetical protein